MLFGYFSSTPKYCIFYLIRIVEVDSPKRGWIMGVCDLNYWLGHADIWFYPPRWNSQPNVSPHPTTT